MEYKDLEMLDALYQNASMGASSIHSVLSKVEDADLHQELENQLSCYQAESQSFRSQIEADQTRPKEIPFWQKASADVGIAVNTLMDSSSQHIAEMMIEGTNMGIVEINKALNNISVSPQIQAQAEQMLIQEEQYINRLKTFL